MQFKLTDAPSMEYDAVYIDIQGVSVGVGNEFYEDGDGSGYYDDSEKDGDLDDDGIKDVEWVKVNIQNPGLYNLLDYRNGKTVLLAGGEIPAGKISQVRLLLGPDSYVVVDGKEYPVKTPSAQTSGLKFNLHETLMADMMYKFTIDFDAARSIVKTGNGKYILKPVIRTYADTYGGTIKGYVGPAEALAHVQLVKNTDTLVALPEMDGKFLFPGLAGGSYELTVIPVDTTGYLDSLLTAVPVVEGQITDLGTITLHK
ncbi:MAG: DUF4382 domain-containing protein [Petrimonas sp.]|nr:DUF4382 domain-containing protein [Petrimonas sp.]